MDSKQIRELLERYWEGETSLEEELQLKKYFAQDYVAEDLEAHQAMFQFFTAESAIKMRQSIRLPIEGAGGARTRRLTHTKWLRNMAAAIVVALGLFFIFSPKQEKLEIRAFAQLDTYDSPELAYEEAKKALFYLSGKMNKGVSTAASSLDKMKTLDEIVNL
ncbi:MAG: hypothetical protein OEQ53_12765 [Saprospiraceae bacterium]|nr:hypothetical protein [Saprospiraceae bacterium]